jgi:hypothetical protein
MMEGPAITHPLFKFYFGFIKKFTPNIHKCPMRKNEEITVKNLTVDYNLIPTSLLYLEGHFRADINYYNTKLGENIYYMKLQVFVSVHKRNPYKKRAKTVKN